MITSTKKYGMMALVIGCAVMSMTTYAQFFAPVPGPDASDIWMRNQLRDMASDVNVSPTPASTPGLDASDALIRNQAANLGTVRSPGSAEEGTLSGAKAGELMNAMFSAIESGDWEAALDKTIDYFNATRNSSLEADVNRAQNLLYASMLSWNTGRREKAREFLDKSIRFMRTGENLGGGCEARAVAFKKKMSSGDLPSRFTAKDIMGTPGLQSYIMELPMAKFNKTIRASIARYEAIGGMADAQKGIYEAEGRWFEKSSKFYARQEYQNATHRTFDPDRPPERGTSDREHWEAAKRIYDIFGK
ncbi:MAG: hypothetical protein IJI35_01285 [Kiritimatiellae bacterium]|nr:hypothetical protein [Kiritimatiellia bacterium]